MYAYSFYLFFDFAGYSAFAISISYLFGVHTPENFNRVPLAEHSRFLESLAYHAFFLVRDHVYMRSCSLLRAAIGSGACIPRGPGYFLAFGLMGLCTALSRTTSCTSLHGNTALCVPHFSAGKSPHYWREGPFWNALAVFITFNAFASVC